MRSKRADLEAVVGKFEDWRAKRRGRLIPEELWRAAVGLLDRHSSSAICGALGLNASRFKQERDARGGAAAGRSRRGLGGGRAERAPRPRLRASGARQRGIVASAGKGFVELPALGVGGAGGMTPPPLAQAPRGAGCRLILESDAGTLSLVTVERAPLLADAICRFVLGALGQGSQA